MDHRKRGRGNVRRIETAHTTTTTKKKAKGGVKKLEVVAEERKEGGGEGLLFAEAAAPEVAVVAAELEVELWSGVDEGMTWATCWFPFWEVEASLYGDVWDYDIWGLKEMTFIHNDTIYF